MPSKIKTTYSQRERQTILNLKERLADPAITPEDALNITRTIKNLRKEAKERAASRWEARHRGEVREPGVKGVAAAAVAARARSRRPPDESERVDRFLQWLREAA